MSLKLQEISLVLPISSRYLLQDISFLLDNGECLALVGPSGAGKTTLLRLLNRLEDPTSGVILLDDQPIKQLPVISLRQKVVLVPQEAKLLGMRVQEALAYPLVLQKLPIKEIEERVETWRSRLHIPQEWLERNELQLSVGQRQLVAITRGLVMQPRILLLDEPTSALDLGTAYHLLEVLTEVSQQSQTAILMVNHQLELVKQWGDRVLYLEQGRLLENIPAVQTDWNELHDRLVQAEAEKGDDDDNF
jgi:D-methionine transport system ATP-binding protein